MVVVVGSQFTVVTRHHSALEESVWTGIYPGRATGIALCVGCVLQSLVVLHLAYT